MIRGIDHQLLKRGPTRAVRKRLEPSTPPAASTGPTAASGVDVAQLGVKKLRPNDHGGHGIWIAFLWKLRWDEFWYICFAWPFVMGGIFCIQCKSYNKLFENRWDAMVSVLARWINLLQGDLFATFVESTHRRWNSIVSWWHDMFFPTTPVTAVWNSGGCRGYMAPASQKSTFHALQCMTWKGFAKTGLCWWLARKTKENFRLCSKNDFEIWFEVCPWTNFVLCHRADLGNDPQKSGRGHAMPINSKFKLTSLFSTLVTLQTLSWSFLIMTDDVAFPVYSKQSSRDEETWSLASCERASLANP